MARLEDVPDKTRMALERLECPRFETAPFVSGPPLADRRVALISTAGLGTSDQPLWRASDPGYRAIPHDRPAADVLMSHVSLGYDRTGFQRDLNATLPRDRLAELAADGEIGSAASTHYSFMGATDPLAMVSVAEVARALKADRVDSVVLLPV